MTRKGIRHFYIPEEQSVYLLSHADAKKLKDWIALCIAQLESLGFTDISLIGKGAYGFAFGGRDQAGSRGGRPRRAGGVHRDSWSSHQRLAGFSHVYCTLMLACAAGHRSGNRCIKRKHASQLCFPASNLARNHVQRDSLLFQ